MSLVWYKVLPPVFGGQKGVAYFNEALGNVANLVCVCSKNNTPEAARSYKVYNWLPVSKSQIVHPIVLYKLIRFVRHHSITHVIVEHTFHAFAALLLRYIGNCTIIIHVHNVEYQRLKDSGKWYWRGVYLLESLCYRVGSEFLFKSDEDLQEVCRLFKADQHRCFVVPYGITPPKTVYDKQISNTSLKAKHGINTNNALLLFTGSPGYPPNQKAVADLYHYLLPLLLPGYTIIITGAFTSDFSFEDKPNFILADAVPDLQEYYTAANVFINPVDTGGGVQTKTLEAIAHHLNVVCWQNKTNGIDPLVVGKKLFTAVPGNWSDFLLKIETAMECKAPTPASFYAYHSFDRHVQLLADRIKKQNA
jgi:glycosyltransferase involved in cell wall biosynthesis